MDPEDLLDQEVEELPGLPDHSTANMDVLKALDALDISYRSVCCTALSAPISASAVAVISYSLSLK